MVTRCGSVVSEYLSKMVCSDTYKILAQSLNKHICPVGVTAVN